jgi:hypothetical protein
MVRTDKSAGIAAAAGHYHVSMPTDIRKNTNVIIIAANHQQRFVQQMQCEKITRRRYLVDPTKTQPLPAE